MDANLFGGELFWAFMPQVVAANVEGDHCYLEAGNYALSCGYERWRWGTAMEVMHYA